MGCFPACFTSSKFRRRHQKSVAVTPSTQLQHQIVEATGEEAVRFEPTKLDGIIKPITESNVIEEKTKNDAKERKVTFDLVEEGIDEKESEKKEEAPKEILGCIGTSVVNVVPLNHRYENCSNSEDEDECVIDLSGSDLNGDDYGKSVDDEVGSNKEIVIQEPESSDSLFSISIDSRKRVSNAEEDMKEVNSPMPKPKPIENSSRNQHCDSVLSPIENLSRWKEVKAKAIDLASKNQEKENMDVEQDFNIPISPEPTVELSKHFTKRPHKSNASDNSVGSLTCEGVSSSRSLGDRPVLGEWMSERA